MRSAATLTLVLLALSPSVSACHSAGLYGHSKTYEPLGDEEDAAAAAVEFDPVMARRSPAEWQGRTVTLFGVVQNRQEGPGGTVRATLSVRTLEPRNLCETADEDSCRVTVSDREHAVVHTLLKLRNDDAIGEHSLGPRSMIRVVGKLSDEVDPTDGAPVLVAQYYRHWPRNYYVTTAARTFMRR
jgi:hypothetical protein